MLSGATADVRLAVLGCGAITELLYLPALRRQSDARVTLLIDINQERRKHVASKFNVEHTHGDIDECYDLFDAAIVALPNSFHATVSVKLLRQRKHVLVARPMAISVTECDAMISAHKQTGAVLAVGSMKRILWARRLADCLLKSNAMGQVKSFDFREGISYNWPVRSNFPFRREKAGGGVLMDTGADTLDCVLHWLGDFSEVEYLDDSEGGVEANCLLNLRLQNGVCGVVELSCTRRLRNTGVIRCESGVIEIGLDRDHANCLNLAVSDKSYALAGVMKGLRANEKDQSCQDLVRSQAEDFIAAIRNGRSPEVDGHAGRRSVRLIENCYRRRKPLELPWIGQDKNVKRCSINSNERILVTGGTGFIGGRLVEMLAGLGYWVRVATSDFRNCARVSRFPIELVKADLNDHLSLADAVTGCTLVFHAAYQFGGSAEEERRANLDGTRALAEAFLRQGGRRFVYISSIMAYGNPRDGQITEDSDQRPSRDAYGNIKQSVERALLKLHHTRGLAVTILQPTIVYGPYGYFFTIRPLDELRSARIALPAGGLCNAVYVDDVVCAALLAAERDTASGETFIISGSSPTTWREFYVAYEKMLNKHTVLELNDVELQNEKRRQLKSRSLMHRVHRFLAKRPELRQRLLNLPPHGWFLAAGQRMLPSAARALVKQQYDRLWEAALEESVTFPHLHSGFWADLYAAKLHAKIDKAHSQLGYNPTFDLNEGMARTTHWARWANLLST